MNSENDSSSAPVCCTGAAIFLCGLCVAVSAAAAGWFLPKQSLWIDETTQLNGIAMGPAQVAHWLAGHEHFPGVAPDRSPPLAYWIAQGWARVFGHGIPAIRWMGVACAALASGIVFVTARRAFGLVSGAAAGMLFALSPNVIVYAVEIRAYPVFLLISSLAVYAFVRQWTTERGWPSKRWLALMTVFCIAAMYVHFFGIVLTGALLGATLLTRVWRGASVWPVLGAIVVAAMGASGVYPFVAASLSLSKELGMSADFGSTADAHPGRVQAVVRMVYRLVGHPAMAPSLLATAAAITGTLLLALVAALLVLRPPPRISNDASNAESTITVGLFAALGLGFIAVTLASLVVKFFPTTAPHYNLWMLPGFFVLLSAALRRTDNGSPSRPSISVIALLAFPALLLTLAGEGYAAVQLGTHGTNFAHGPYDQIAKIIGELGPERVTLIEDGPEVDMSAGVYFPIHYRFGDRVSQYVFKSAGDEADGKIDPATVELRRFEAVRTTDPSFDLPSLPLTEFVMIVRSRNVSAAELADRLRDESPGQPLLLLLQAGPAAKAFKELPGWEQFDPQLFLSLVAARVEIFQRHHPE